MLKITTTIIVLITVCISCMQAPIQNNFKHDIEILKKIEDLKILKLDNSLLAVSAAYQGRIFTSSLNSMNGRSLGYFNRKLVAKGKSANVMSKLGGEGRMFFGPEIGKYSIFFDPGKKQVVENIKISPDLNNVHFKLLEETPSSITCGNKMQIRNANGYIFNIDVKRKIALKSKEDIENDLGIRLNPNISHIGFSANTTVKNIGKEQWTKAKGLLSIWDLGCLLPSENNTIIIPTRGKADSTNIYFTEIDDNRIRINEHAIFYKADAKYMNKIGTRPINTKNIFGSYSPELKLLNIVKFNFEDDSLYVNSIWGHKHPYKGDVINIFNGEVNSATDRDWPFYEVETSSSAKELRVGETMHHCQTIYHFEGEEKYLNEIAKKVLGTGLHSAKQAFE